MLHLLTICLRKGAWGASLRQCAPHPFIRNEALSGGLSLGADSRVWQIRDVIGNMRQRPPHRVAGHLRKPLKCYPTNVREVIIWN